MNLHFFLQMNKSQSTHKYHYSQKICLKYIFEKSIHYKMLK